MARIEMRGMTGFGFDQIAVDNPLASEALRLAEDWAASQTEPVSFRFMSPALVGDSRRVIEAQPPLDPERARGLGQRLCNSLGIVHIRTGISQGVISTETLLPRHSDGTLITNRQPGYVDLNFDTPDTYGQQFFTRRASAE